MATVNLGRLLGNAGFTRVVAIKRLHAQLAKDPEFSAMFLDEARLAARIHHPHVVDVLDVVAEGGELFLVMPYVHGDSLAHLLRRARDDASTVPLDVAAAIMIGVLHGLHAAHEARGERGAPLHLVHRDVSPQNVLVGADGVARVIDFGIAKAVGRARVTRDASIRGKIAYMAPEQLQGEEVDRRSDVYAAGVVLWELLTGHPLFASDSNAATLTRALHHRVAPPSSVDARVPVVLDEVVMRATDRVRSRRFATAREMASAIERAVTPASTARVAEWVEELASDVLGARSAAIVHIEALRDGEDSFADTEPAAAPVVSSSTSASGEAASPSWPRRALGAVVIAACLVSGVAFFRLRNATRALGDLTSPTFPLPTIAPVDAAAAPPPLAPSTALPDAAAAVRESVSSTHGAVARPAKATTSPADPAAYQ